MNKLSSRSCTIGGGNRVPRAGVIGGPQPNYGVQHLLRRISVDRQLTAKLVGRAFGHRYSFRDEAIIGLGKNCDGSYTVRLSASFNRGDGVYIAHYRNLKVPAKVVEGA